MPSNHVTWPCKEVTSSHGSRSMAWYILPMPCAFGHMSMVSFFTHGFASHKGFLPPMILKVSKFSYNYEPSSRRPSVYLQWTAQYITLGVPSNWQFHLANINKQMLNYAHFHPRVINAPAADDDAGDLFLRATEQLWILWYTLPDFVHLLTFLRSTLLQLHLPHRELKSWAMPRAWHIP